MANTEESARADLPGGPFSADVLTDEGLLTLAAELVALGWCRTALAADRAGRQVEPWSTSARSWSPLGALIAIWFRSQSDQPAKLETAYAAFAIATGGRPEEWSAAPWRTKWHVLSAFARARRNLPDARAQIREGSRDRSSSGSEEAPSERRWPER